MNRLLHKPLARDPAHICGITPGTDSPRASRKSGSYASGRWLKKRGKTRRFKAIRRTLPMLALSVSNSWHRVCQHSYALKILGKQSQ
jgi:hypothetical protein